MTLAVAIAGGLVLVLVLVVAALLAVVRSTGRTVDTLAARIVALEDGTERLREVLGDVDHDLGRVADALTERTPPMQEDRRG